MAIETLRPNAAGDVTGIAVKFGDNANYLCVDEVVSDDDTTHISTGGGYDQYDLYNLPAHSGAGLITRIVVKALSKGYFDGSPSIYPVIKIGGTVYYGSATVVPPNIYTPVSYEWPLNPKTGLDWTWQNIDDLQIGVRHVTQDSYGHGARTTQVWVEVEYFEFTAAFSADHVKGVIPHAVQFADECYGGYTPFVYDWDFGDGSTHGTSQNPQHTYAVPGYYTVSLAVTDNTEAEASETKTDYIMAQAPEINTALDEEEDVTPGTTDEWIDINATSFISANATGVMLHIINDSATEQTWGVRKNGSADTVTGKIAAGAQTWAYIGVDSGKKFEAYISSTSVRVYIYAYTMFGVSFLDSLAAKTLSTGWKDINCATEVGSDPNTVGLIFLIKNISADTLRAYGIRKNGSSDSYTQGQPGYLNIGPGQMCFAVIGCDAAFKCEFQPSNTTDIKLYLVGYIHDGATFSTNATDKSLSLYVSYEDIDLTLLNADCGWAMVQINAQDKAGRYAALRYPGDVADDYKIIQYGAWKWQKVSMAHVFEAKIQDSNIKFFIIGFSAETQYLAIDLDGFVKLGSSVVEGAEVFCYNLTRRIFVGGTVTDADGEYTFVDAGYKYEDFLVACHYIDANDRRYGACKKVQLDDE